MPAIDGFEHNGASLTSPIESGFAITPHDSNELTHITRQLFVGSGGNLSVTLKNGDELTFTNLPNAYLLDCRVKAVKATGTTASGILGLY